MDDPCKLAVYSISSIERTLIEVQDDWSHPTNPADFVGQIFIERPQEWPGSNIRMSGISLPLQNPSAGPDREFSQNSKLLIINFKSSTAYINTAIFQGFRSVGKCP